MREVYVYPFATKVLSSGERVYRREKGYEFDLVIGENTLVIDVTFSKCMINIVEILNCSMGEKVSLEVIDTDAGTYTGTPGQLLDLFGDEKRMKNEYHVSASEYEATLYQGMKIRLTYHSHNEKKLYVNIPWHEVLA